MSSIIFITRGEEKDTYTDGSIVNGIGSDNLHSLEIKNVGYQNTFLIKNDDNSLEILTVMKRPTADLVLPDNRMGVITVVSYHKKLEEIPLDKIGMNVITNANASMETQIEDVFNIIEYLKKGDIMDYITIDENYNIIREGSIDIKRSKQNTIVKGKDLLTSVRKIEQDLDIIQNIYITSNNKVGVTNEWLQKALTSSLTIKEGEEIPIKGILTQRKATSEPTTEPATEPTSKPITESTTEPATEPTSKPTTEPTTEPATEPTTEPTTESTTEPAMRG